MKCKTKLRVQWGKVMFTDTDWQKIKEKAAAFWDFGKRQATVLPAKIKPALINAKAKLFVNKETTIKAVLPILVVAVGFYACTASQKTINKNVNEIFLISDQIREHYANKPDYWGLSTETVLQNKFISPVFIQNGKIMLSGGKEIFIGNGQNADIVMPRSTSFDIILPKLTKAQCIAMAEAELASENEVKLTAVQIINAGGEYLFEWGGVRRLPISKYASKDLCIDGDNTLIWSLH